MRMLGKIQQNVTEAVMELRDNPNYKILIVCSTIKHARDCIRMAYNIAQLHNITVEAMTTDSITINGGSIKATIPSQPL